MGKAWVSQSICNPCRTMLYLQASNTKTKYLMEMPAIWNEPRTNEECYACMTKFNGMISSKHVRYSDAVSFTPPVYNNVFISGNAINSNASVAPVMDNSEMNVIENSTNNESEIDISEELQESVSDKDDDDNSEDLCSKRGKPIRPRS